MLAEQLLARACENEAENAKRMRMGIEPVSQSLPSQIVTSQVTMKSRYTVAASPDHRLSTLSLGGPGVTRLTSWSASWPPHTRQPGLALVTTE